MLILNRFADIKPFMRRGGGAFRRHAQGGGRLPGQCYECVLS